MFRLKEWNWLSPREAMSRQEVMETQYRQRQFIEKKFQELVDILKK